MHDLGVTPQSSAVVTAIIALARSLGLRVIGEGVENLRQMEVLHRLGCGAMQGFLFSRAIPPDDLERWLEQTVLPRKAPWIGQASTLDFGAEAPRAGRGPPLLIAAEQHMDLSQGAAQIANAASPLLAPAISAPVHLAKAALRRLALDKLEPTPENYARAYAAESGQAASVLSERARPVLQRMAAQIGAQGGSRDALVKALMAGRWDEADRALEVTAADSAAHARGWAELDAAPGARARTRQPAVDRGTQEGKPAACAGRRRQRRAAAAAACAPVADPVGVRGRRGRGRIQRDATSRRGCALPRLRAPEPAEAAPAEAAVAGMPAAHLTGDWMAIVNSLQVAVQAGLPDAEPRAAELTGQLAEWLRRMPDAGATPDMAAEVEA